MAKKAPASPAEKASPKAAAWARRFTDEVLGLIETKSTPELGGIGMSGSAAVFLAILNGGGVIEPRLQPFFPWGQGALSLDILARLPPAQRDALMAQGVTTPPNWKRPPQ